MNHSAEKKRKEFNEILHDLNQPLTAINNYALAGSSMLASGNADLARLRELFDKIAEQSLRTVELSRELRDFDRALPPED